ncbi:hypothetical protein GXB85_14455 [Cellulomonas sp. APG4]|uniref:hypothetical protein n=1 Tax=Cellulomonas sp. APG4 TaxID=1538656 RepID=UPI00137B117A|nr:hypothetical protein [Cellulomonas sp. APG4]NCT92146.1 hypothetical protein [Cellulomonas sp. APG4]
MRLVDSDGNLVVAVTHDELRLLASSIGETLEAVEEWEFSTRLGFDVSAARALRSDINEILARAADAR